MRISMVVVALTVVLGLSACGTQNGQGSGGAADAGKHSTTNTANKKHRSNGLIIPSETGDKKQTTNQNGHPFSGKGEDLYGSIGTSNVHAGGISSYFESILKGEDIQGIHVFVVDDTVILARAKPKTTSHQYDNMQKDVLNGHKGMSGKGEPEGKPTKGADGDNLKQAKTKIDDMFEGHVKILTTTDGQTPKLANRIKKEMKQSSYQAATKDIRKLLQLTK